MGQMFSKTPNEQDQGLASSFVSYFKNFKMETKILSPEAIRSIKDHLLNGDMQRANAVITAVLKDIDNSPLNIAVTGGSGAGKSSFINALRGIGHEEEGAAPTGAQETTMERKKYEYANAPNVTLWDLPGIGTPNFQPKDYLEKVKFKEYDFFLIVSATRFGINDIELAKAIKFMKKDFYFVRSKVDSDLMNEQRSKPKSFEREKVLQGIRNYCVETFEQNGVEVPEIFLISSHDLADYDFPILTDTLLRNLPAQKRQVFLNSLPNITETTIEMKRETERQHIWLEAFKAGALATFPVVGIVRDDERNLEDRLNRYRTCFGVDDKSLQSFADNLKVPVETLMTIIQSPHLLKTTKEEQLGEKLLKYLEIFCSINGGLLASGLYFRKYHCLLLHFLDIVSNDAKVLLKETYSKDHQNPTASTTAGPLVTTARVS
ncbi:interferon-inducible GTPase 1-like isoform X1 [Perognathus longimembris pacificus]|uniref:interferon-inducible GTPase 1-like isoform X1 n=1 Tax=Perognathus longimembris pacificus TaxID=214514 RepID=UPI002019290E|nr:interferon-inducible GTPase 1-like isoform X1 [Perognathus longimembris pacificus]XP_048187465.1 interferon-inducible GTPase 1-like isoform X1 [Perognathus longimembris pacificus]